MTVTQMLNMLDVAIADAEAQVSRLPWRRRRALVVHFTTPTALGQVGRPAGRDEEQRPIFGYTLAQCRRMRRTILAAAREDYEATMEEA